MKKRIANVLMVILGGMLCLSCGVSNVVGRIIIKQTPRRENFTNEQLSNFITKNTSPTIVVRGWGNAGAVSTSSPSNKICSLLEEALAKKGFDVRDRGLFESVISSRKDKPMTYQDIYHSTQVDLIMEVASYSLNDRYLVEGYYDESNSYQEFPEVSNGRKDPNAYHPSYEFIGMSVTVKIVLLKDNLIGGYYNYSYVPCSEESGGADIVKLYPLIYRYRDNANKGIEDIANDARDGHLIVSGGERMSRAMENWMEKVVVPGIMESMKRTDIGMPVVNTSSVQSSRSQQTPPATSSAQDAPAFSSETSASESGTTLDSLLSKYNVEEIMEKYRQALQAKDKKKVNEFEDYFDNIKDAVSDKKSLPKSLKNQFEDYIDDTMSTIKKQVKEGKRDSFVNDLKSLKNKDKKK